MRGRGRKNDNLESGKFHIRLTTCESSVPESHTLKTTCAIILSILLTPLKASRDEHASPAPISRSARERSPRRQSSRSVNTDGDGSVFIVLRPLTRCPYNPSCTVRQTP